MFVTIEIAKGKYHNDCIVYKSDIEENIQVLFGLIDLYNNDNRKQSIKNTVSILRGTQDKLYND